LRKLSATHYWGGSGAGWLSGLEKAFRFDFYLGRKGTVHWAELADTTSKTMK
jgi:hypothetical protein